MKTSISLIKKLARLGVLETETLDYKKDGDITIENSNGEEVRVLTDNVTDEDLLLLVATEQLKNIKYIKSVVRGYVIGCAITLGIILLNYLIQLGGKIQP